MVRYRGCALRRGRMSEQGRAYLVTAVTAGRRPWFRELALGRLVVAEMRAACEDGEADTLAWVLMPDHLHWLFVLGGTDLPDLVRRVKSNSGRQVHRVTGGAGTLWQRGYHDHAIRRDEDLRQTARYIVANPLRAGLVEDLGAYPLWDAVWV